ncbi:MAG TPA: Wzz/FepE/Etk N-terminal domain-containing protein [Gaiellaceae bacterium]|nr:Wzz/FepE/Etk N-terminal domain-containing protein [Gaiellaceae bacterium]
MAQHGNGLPAYVAPALPPDQPVETGRYLDALRRSKLLIAVIVVALTAVVVVISLLLPTRYRATAKIVLESTSDPLQTRDVESSERRLATIDALLTTRDTRRRAAKSIPGETAATLEGKVESSVVPNADIVGITATDDTAAGAARIANAVAATFLNRQRRSELRRLRRARAKLTAALAALEGRRGLQAQTERAEFQRRLTEFDVSAAGAGSELSLAEAANAPSAPFSPRPVRNGAFAMFASLFIAALVVLARAQLKPRVSGSREVSRLLELPVLVEVPHVRRPLGQRPQTLSSPEYEAYQTLQASVRRALPPTGQRTILITSALHGEGKTEVTAGLGLVLSQAMYRTWLVSADMRRPRLHELFDVDQTPGLSEVLVGAHNGGRSGLFQLTASRTDSGTLHVLASGRTPPDPAQLLASDALDGFFEDIGESEYDYVLLDGPPLLGLVDSQVLAQRVDGVLIVCRPERHTPETAIALRELLERLDVRPLGVVVVGARVPSHSYLPG